MGRLSSLPCAVVTDDSALGGAILGKSLRFSESNGNEYLSRTPSSASNQKTYTFSCWYRRSRTTYSLANVLEQKNNGQNYAVLYFQPDDKLNFHGYTSTGGNQYTHRLVTTQVFRDANSWFHIVVAVDTTQSTADDRVKIYVNGSQITNFDVRVNPSQNFDTFFNSTQLLTIGRGQAGSAQCYDGYMAEINFVDGFQLTPSSFGFTEFQTGIWKPKGYFGSYGTNGFRLDFSDDSGTTAVTLGKDRSGQGNDFTPNNFSVSAGVDNDSFLESPTTKKEFARFNSNLQIGADTECRHGNTAFFTAGTNTVQTRANMSRRSGKWYAEFTLSSYTHRSGSIPYIGVARAEGFSNTYAGNSGTAYNASGHIYRSGGQLETGHASYTQGDVISVAINLDSSPPQVWWAKNGSYIRSGNPVTAANGVNIEPASISGDYTFTASLYANPGQWDANFGHRPFAHSVPEGYKTLNTDNFPINTPPIIRPQKHFGAIVYTPNSGGLTVTGLEFTPDLIWVKSRTQLYRHYLWDSVRGPGQKALSSNTQDAEGADATTIGAFVEGGFTLPGASGINDNGSGTNGVVAWCWKAGGAPTTTNSASVGSVPTAGSVKIDGADATSALAGTVYPNKMSVNTTAGFSISQYTGTGGSFTLAHGLTKRPDATLVKTTNTNSTDWILYTKAFDGSNDFLILNSNASSSNSGLPGVNDTIFEWGGGSGYSNTNGRSYIMYNWTSIPGYSKIGYYNALGSTDGAYVELGFRPAFILIKPGGSFGGSDQNYSTWGLWDSTRSPSNVVTYAGMLTANKNNLEQVRGNGSNDGALAAFDILGTGFKVRNSAYEVGYSGVYFYMAFAEQAGQSPYHTDTNAR